MRKTLTPLLLATALLPLSAFAQQPIGVYVAPRLGYGTMKGTFTAVEPGYDDEKIGSQSKGAAILGLAVSTADVYECPARPSAQNHPHR